MSEGGKKKTNLSSLEEGCCQRSSTSVKQLPLQETNPVSKNEKKYTKGTSF